MRKQIALLLVAIAIAGCGGGGSTAVDLVQAPEQSLEMSIEQATGTATFGLGLLKDASGVPQGIRIYWTRVDVPGVLGYYIYKDTSPLPSGDPDGESAYRIDAGGTSGMKDQYGTGTDTLQHDDLFAAAVGTTYYYRITVVNSTSDESDFSSELSIAVAQHAITSISPSTGSIGDTITITGTHFSDTQEGTDKVYFTDSTGSTTVEATVTSWTDTEVQATVPYGAADGDIGVEIDGTMTLTPDGQEFDYNEPAISDVSPTEDWVNNSYITFTGTDFGPSGELGVNTFVYFASTAATDYDTGNSDDTTVLCKVPAAATGDSVTAYISVDGNDSGTVSFTILPHIDSLSTATGSTGTSITITGTNFGATQSTGSVTFNSESASITSWSNTSVVAVVPTNALDGDVVLTRADTNTTNGGGFDVIPTFSSFSSVRREIGETVTINGSGYGASRGTSTVTFDAGGGVGVVTYGSWSATTLVVTVPDGAETGTVTIDIVDTDVSGSDDDEVTTTSITLILPPPDLDNLEQL